MLYYCCSHRPTHNSVSSVYLDRSGKSSPCTTITDIVSKKVKFSNATAVAQQPSDRLRTSFTNIAFAEAQLFQLDAMHQTSSDFTSADDKKASSQIEAETVMQPTRHLQVYCAPALHIEGERLSRVAGRL